MSHTKRRIPVEGKPWIDQRKPNREHQPERVDHAEPTSPESLPSMATKLPVSTLTDDTPVAVAAAVCYFAVLRALQFASMRSKATGRNSRHRFRCEQYLVHTLTDLRAEGDEWSQLLRGAWDMLPVVLPGPTERYEQVCEQYTRDLIEQQRIPDRADLYRLLDEA